MPHFAPGIKNKSKFGDLDKVNPKDLLTYVIQEHIARRAGKHFDLRAGTPKTDLFSWVTRKQMPEEGKSVGVFRQPIHDFDYKDFEGVIPAESYGGGTVEKKKEGKILITKKDDKKNIHFTTADTQTPKRFALINAAGRDNPRHNLLVRGSTPAKVDVKKPKYKSIDPDKLKEYLASLGPEDTVEPKIDGALAYVNLKKKDLDILSHRTSKRTGKPIFHTERVFGERPEVDVPKEFNNSVLLGELYGSRKGKPIPQQELGGILNSNIDKSLEKQKSQNVDLQTMLFDYVQKAKKNLSDEPYAERRKLLEQILPYLPKGKFHLSEQAKGPDEGQALLAKIRAGKHPLTNEGVIVHKTDGEAAKAKLMEEADVYVRKIFGGEGKYKDVGAGGFEYSHTPTGEVVGKVGTGISDELRKDLLKNPAKYLNHIARVRAQQKFPSGALRAPSLIGMHLDY